MELAKLVYAPWMNPDIFNGGDPNLLCSSTDYIFLFNDLDLRANINSFSEKSPGEALLLRERLTRDFNLRLGCILQHADKYKEAFEVSYAFQSMMLMVNLHNQLDTRLKPAPSLNDLQLLDRELEYLWDEIILLTEQVYGEVSDRRASTALIYVMIGFFNFMGMVGGIIMYAAFAGKRFEEVWNKDKHDWIIPNYSDLPVVEKLHQLVQEILQWIFIENPPPSYFLMSIGSVFWTAAPIGWGYAYWMAYLMFVEAADPGCGSIDREEVYNRYFQLGSLNDLMSTGISKPAVTYILRDLVGDGVDSYQWGRISISVWELRITISCFLNYFLN